jgi:hypothetical protein
VRCLFGSGLPASGFLAGGVEQQLVGIDFVEVQATLHFVLGAGHESVHRTLVHGTTRARASPTSRPGRRLRRSRNNWRTPHRNPGPRKGVTRTLRCRAGPGRRPTEPMEIGIDAITAGADEPGMHAADPQH